MEKDLVKVILLLGLAIHQNKILKSKPSKNK